MNLAAVTGLSLNWYSVFPILFTGYLSVKVLLFLMSVFGLRVTVAHANAQSYDGYLSAIKPQVSKVPVKQEIKQEVEPDVTPEPVVEVKPEVSPEPVVEVEADVSPEPVVEVEADVSPEPVVEVEPDVSPEPAVEVKPDVTPELVVEVETDVAPEPVVEVEPDVSPEPDVEGVYDFGPDNIIVLSDLRPEDFEESTCVSGGIATIAAKPTGEESSLAEADDLIEISPEDGLLDNEAKGAFDDEDDGIFEVVRDNGAFDDSDLDDEDDGLFEIVPDDGAFNDEDLNDEDLNDEDDDLFEIVTDDCAFNDEDLDDEAFDQKSDYPQGLVILGENEVLFDDNAIDPTFWSLTG